MRRRPRTSPHVQVHSTPTYRSWLNQVELWFAKIERDSRRAASYPSVADLARKSRHIKHYNKVRSRSTGLSRSGASHR